MYSSVIIIQIIKSIKMIWWKQVRFMQRTERLMTKKFVGNPEWKTSLGRPTYIQENNTEIRVLIKKEQGVWVWSVFD